MLTRLVTPCVVLPFKHKSNSGFTMIDVIAHIFLLGLLFVAGPVFLHPTPVDSGAASLYRATLLIRGR